MKGQVFATLEGVQWVEQYGHYEELGTANALRLKDIVRAQRPV